MVIWLTCYFRHLKQTFRKAGIEITKDNKREIDKIIHDIVGIEYKQCPATWREVKKRLAENENEFVTKLKNEWTKKIDTP